MLDNRCPKCGKKLSIFYLKQECPGCGANILYYNLDERLRADAEDARAQVEAFNRFSNMIKTSSVGSLLQIIRLVLFFTPLGSMCLTMFNINGRGVSLISLIKEIIGGGFSMGALTADTPYFLSVLTMVFIILLSLAEIISSLFSAGKNGLKRNIAFSAVNLAVFLSLSAAVLILGGTPGIGFAVTLFIYLICDFLHFAVNKKINA